MVYQVDYACISHPGKMHAHNEDNYILGDDFMDFDNDGTHGVITGRLLSDRAPALLAVFDGLSGEEYGEMAAWHGARAIVEYVEKGVESTHRILRHANRVICQHAYDSSIIATGTTVNLLRFGPSSITAANIGNSRTYRISKGGKERLSEDHTVPVTDGKRAPLDQYLGIPSDELTLEPHVISCPIKLGDLYLLCTDGLSDYVSEADIASIMRKEAGAEGLASAAEALFQAAIDAGSEDDITLIVCRIVEAPKGIRGLFGHFRK